MDNSIPRGIEVLVKKASVDAAFRATLLTKRAEAVAQIGLELDAAETAMLAVIPESQLIGIIESTRVSPKARPVFMGYAAATMLAALGVTTGCGPSGDETTPEETAPPVYGDTPSDKEELTPDNENESDEGLGFSETSGVDTDIGEISGGGYGNGTGTGITGIRPDGGFGGFSESKGTGATGIRPDTDFVENRTVEVSGSCASIGGPGATDDSRSRGAINAKIRGHLAGIQNLYNSEIKKNPVMSGGKIVVRFTILADGFAENV
ncbi:MAG: hypothetical protein GY771_15665 [bacterium]|nr:hypothetical protein [bacterium]